MQDLSWSEDRKTKAVAVEFRTVSTSEPLYVTYRLEPEGVIEEAAFLGRYRFSNLLGFYPWPDPAMRDVRYYSRLENTNPTPATLTFDGQELDTQRYVTSEIVVDVAFFTDVSLAVARPPSPLDLPALTSAPYESLRPELPAADPPGYHASLDTPGAVFQGLVSYEQFDPRADHSCVFCEDTDWQWILEMRPPLPRARLTWPPVLVACTTCHSLYRAGLLDELRQRIAEAGDDLFLEVFDLLLPQILASERRR
ncbi:MAG TPA: hypothetical protein VF557_05625 [Jatrophihabitans sp.]|uniref:hypothetical protein n=1 Tax=Jatrophihabitans sp. TaxID=1932789 RepID=UPI002EF98E81